MDIKELHLSARDAWNKKDKEAFFAYMSENIEITMPGGLVLRGLQGLETQWSVWQGAFPDNQAPITNIFAAGDQACAQATFEGTHTGTLHGADGSQIPSTGRHVSLPIVHVSTVRDGKFRAFRIYFCRVELLTQLGLMPALADA